MNDDEPIVSVKILGRQYRIKCPTEQAQELEISAQRVDERMRKLRRSDNSSSTENIAIVAALNLGHELLSVQKQKDDYIHEMNQRIHSLQQKLEKFLAASEEVAI